MKVVLLEPLSADGVARIESVDPRVRVVQAWELFAPELVSDWPAYTLASYLPSRLRGLADSPTLQQQRDEVLRDAEVLCIGFPYPTRLRVRAPHLRFAHHLRAGVSNLERSDFWHGPIPVTSGRGAGNSQVIAEWVIAAILALGKEFPRAFAQQASGHFERSSFRGWQVAGKTMGIAGLGGIGRQVARLAGALGMHVVGSRRSMATDPVKGVEQLYPPAGLHTLLGRCDVVVLAAQLTHETYQFFNHAAFAAMRPGSLLVNVARGELIDEAALLQALRSGHLRGFAADVYAGEFDHPPPTDLVMRSDVLFTPHVSAHSDQPATGTLELFCENLRRCLSHQPLLNEVDWTRGY